MYRLDITRDAMKSIESLQTKQYRQVVTKVFSLMKDARPSDAQQLRDSDYWRVDVGEFRIVYRNDKEFLYIHVIGKRNDGEVYKDLARKQVAERIRNTARTQANKRPER